MLVVGIVIVLAVIFGGLFSDFIEDYLCFSFVIVCMMVFFGLLLWVLDKVGKGELSVEKIIWNFVFFIGCV